MSQKSFLKIYLEIGKSKRRDFISKMENFFSVERGEPVLTAFRNTSMCKVSHILLSNIERAEETEEYLLWQKYFELKLLEACTFQSNDRQKSNTLMS